MSNEPFVKIQAATAAEICQRFDLKDEARPLLGEGMEPRVFVEALVAQKQYLSGIDFIAHGLPAREGIWWGCLCMQHACGDSLSPTDRAAGIAAVRWVMQPTEKNRAAAKAPADAAGPASPAGVLAAAASQTGGNAAPPKAPPMPPGPFAPAKAVAMAVKLATLKAAPAAIVETQRLFLDLGIKVAEGRFS